MNGRDSDGFSAIWSTWFVDRLFIVDELARKQRPETIPTKERKGASGCIVGQAARPGAPLRRLSVKSCSCVSTPLRIDSFSASKSKDGAAALAPEICFVLAAREDDGVGGAAANGLRFTSGVPNGFLDGTTGGAFVGVAGAGGFFATSIVESAESACPTPARGKHAGRHG